MSFRTLLNRRCDIERPTETQSSTGATVETWSKVYRFIPCRIQPISGTENVVWNKETVIATHKMFLEHKGRTITEKDRVIFNSLEFDIVFVRNVDAMNHHFELILRQVKEETAAAGAAGGYGAGGYGS